MPFLCEARGQKPVLECPGRVKDSTVFRNQGHDQNSAAMSKIQGLMQQQKQQLVVAAAPAFLHYRHYSKFFGAPKKIGRGP